MNGNLTSFLFIGLSSIFALATALLVFHWPRYAAANEAASQRSIFKIAPDDPHALSLVRWEHPANQGVLAALHQRRPNDNHIDQQAEDGTHVPGAHADITAYVFETLKAELPDTCRWIVYSRPALVHPTSGVIFAFGIGDDCVALRLPLDERGPSWTDECVLSDDCISVDEIGADWSFMQGFASASEPVAAYEYASWL